MKNVEVLSIFVVLNSRISTLEYSIAAFSGHVHGFLGRLIGSFSVLIVILRIGSFLVLIGSF